MLVLHRLVPPRAALARRASALRARAGRARARAARADARRAAGHLRPLRLAAAPARLRELGRVGGARAGARAAPAATDVPVRARPRPQRGARRRRGAPRARWTCRWSSRCTAATCSTRPPAAAGAPRARRRSRAGWARRGWCSPTARASPSSAARTAPGEMRVVHLGADLPDAPRRAAARRAPAPTLVTVAHLVARKRHADVLRALAVLGRDTRRCATRSSATGPSGSRSKASPRAWASPIASTSTASSRRSRRVEQARRGTLFVMPSTEEAFGVAYIEAMAGGVPAIGCRGEPGPEEIAAAGDGFVLVPPGRHRAADPAHRRAALRPAPAARGGPARARDRRRALHLGALRRADARRLRARAAVRDEAGPVRHRPRAPRPRGRVRGACTSARTSSSRCSAAAPCTADPPGVRPDRAAGELPFPHRYVPPARAGAARGERRLPRGRVLHRRPRWRCWPPGRARGAGACR